MWLEAMYASLSVSGVCGSVLLVNKIFPAETKRFLRLFRAEVGARFGKTRRPTLEVALLAGSDVSFEWWDEEFAKLDRSTVTSEWTSWSSWVSRRLDYDVSSDLAEMSMSIQDMEPPTAAEINYRIANPIKSYSAGGIMYEGNVSYRQEGVNIASLRVIEEQRLKTLEAARTRALDMLAKSKRMKLIPRNESVRLRTSLELADSHKRLEEVVSLAIKTANAYAMLQDRCSDCQYVETQNFANSSPIFHRTERCDRCTEEIDYMKSLGYGVAA